jgi:spore germination protein KA
MMFLSAFMGFYGVAFGFLAVMIHLSTLDSFGVPYFDGFAWTHNLQDSVVRMPLWTMVKRPKGIAEGDVKRRRFFFPAMRPFSEEDDGEGNAQ